MNKTVLVQVDKEWTKVAVLEEDRLVEVHWEQNDRGAMVGNIYRGRVENVLPGMQAAFVDIGWERNAFLVLADALPAHLKDLRASLSIGDILKPGQEVTVQVLKEGIGGKGPRVTCHLTLPGRWVVLLPDGDQGGVSRRIEDPAERERLRKLADRLRQPGMGLIVRTTAAGASEEELAADVARLGQRWARIQEKASRRPAPCLIESSGDLVERLLRDRIDDGVEQIRVNDRDVYSRMWEWAGENLPALRPRLRLEEGRDFWAEQNLHSEIEKALRPKVWLKSGGYLVIEETEALTVIDVNTGRFTGTVNLEETIRQTNIEAAQEVSRQLRLREIGGIIVIDFIDMRDDRHRAEVLETLEAHLARDKARTSVLGLTALGLVEMTRKKVRQSLGALLTVPCECCEGRGRVVKGEAPRDITP
ncbi:ribonuclease, rne/rng family [Heliomicrobium modesticaldum Ice1]|uniref:Ribonuclease, rne/rng family n=1 Tax=Heliobacterium modesticaldum (strain ATCC 51547 / Ice1) TaxID=498761 RepID=B0TBW8_HELMI|nr:Rne/Rng family ribonuclease [Heliomicrobium modesticaldum]ABZ85241.1 ribonuclease, rne/rng family [Heliomicrobium modesticaldum Ice1]